MLRQVEGFTTQEWDEQYPKYREKIKDFRSEIRKISDRSAAILAISKIDGYVSLPMLMTIIGDIRAYTERCIEDAFRQTTGKEIKRIIVNKSIREIIAHVNAKDIRTVFEELIEQTRLADLNEEKVRATIDLVIKQFYEDGIKKYLKAEVQDEKARALFFPLIANEFFCIAATDMYGELDDRQTAGAWAIIGKMAPYLMKKFPAEALQNPFIIIREMAKLVSVDEATKMFWNELALWQEGLCFRSYMQVPEKYRQNNKVIATETGKMPVINNKDQKFQENFGLTMYEISIYHGQTAQQLLLKCTPKMKEEQQIPAETKKQVEQEVKVVQEKAIAPVKSVEQANHPVIEQEQPLVPKPPAFFQPVKAVVHEQNILPIEELKSILHESVDMQFTMLISSLQTHQLSERQKKIFEQYSGVITSTLGEYLTAKFSSYFVPTFIWSRPHTALVNESISNIERANSPLDQIQVLFTLWQELKKAGSHDLISKVSDLLKNIVTMLYKGAELDKNLSLMKQG